MYSFKVCTPSKALFAESTIFRNPYRPPPPPPQETLTPAKSGNPLLRGKRSEIRCLSQNICSFHGHRDSAWFKLLLLHWSMLPLHHYSWPPGRTNGTSDEALGQFHHADKAAMTQVYKQLALLTYPDK